MRSYEAYRKHVVMYVPTTWMHVSRATFPGGPAIAVPSLRHAVAMLFIRLLTVFELPKSF